MCANCTRFNKTLFATFTALISSCFPFISSRRNKIGLERKVLEQGLYSFTVVRHTLFFLYETDSVIIVRILHSSQDIVRHLQRP
ncbi:type II toxin-antitoxin system RelE/ParE family toxin [Pectobacterium punjabense]|nr:type II toxin-antitoxin system RelE/ParE family toxin [Pectobacterium punjabense]MBT9184104.1 type II toxin-antitoxin system RelE/ParE family toxin [Pectobacterium punjabense]